jgi:hypothetical protein
VRRFVVVENSMQPALQPGDGLLAVWWPRCRTGQIRVFADPTKPSRHLVKRVGGVRRSGSGVLFEAVSDNASAYGVVDSRRFGWVRAARSYRVVCRVALGQRDGH